MERCFKIIILCLNILHLIIKVFAGIGVNLRQEYEAENFPNALIDIVFGFNTKSLTIYTEISENSTDLKLIQLQKFLQNRDVATIMFQNIQNNSDGKQRYFNYLSKAIEYPLEITSVLFCTPVQCEDLLDEMSKKNLIHRYLLYVFYWGGREPSNRFMVALREAMRVAVVTNPRTGVYRLYYNQVRMSKVRREGLRPLVLVNWWENGRLYRARALPSPIEEYSDLEGRIFRVPVLHAPPWHFVKLHNKTSIEVTGGRDHQLLCLLAAKLNFKFEYFDPPQHSQGSGISGNGSFKGVLGMIYRREADFFLGDVTMSWERQRGMEFSFLTLADSEAFVTHARRRLSEALGLLRPFRCQVWLAIVATVVGSGPGLWAVAAGPALWSTRQVPRAPSLAKCTWFTMSIFLKQCGRIPVQNICARALVLLLSFSATYVLSDMYSATLTSLLARPTLERPLATLPALEQAMLTQQYQLLVERHSSSLAILQNDTGTYGRLWNLMLRQKTQTVRSVVQGVRRVLDHDGPPIAFLAGRETLYFNTRRFGASNFQLSEKLYTRYSAIALQVGCPYIENFNQILLRLFEAGILTKITYQEYEKLGVEIGAESIASSEDNSANSEDSSSASSSSNGGNTSTQRMGAVSMQMLQGAFYILLFGYTLSGIALIFELYSKWLKQSKHYFPRRKEISSATFRNFSLRLSYRMQSFIRKRNSEVPQHTLDYVE